MNKEIKDKITLQSSLRVYKHLLEKINTIMTRYRRRTIVHDTRQIIPLRERVVQTDIRKSNITKNRCTTEDISERVTKGRGCLVKLLNSFQAKRNEKIIFHVIYLRVVKKKI